MKVSLPMSFSNGGWIEFGQPVTRYHRGRDMKIEALKRIIHVGVFLDPPILSREIIFDEIDPIDDGLADLSSLFSFLPVKDVGLGYLRKTTSNEGVFDDVLDLFHMGDVSKFEKGSVKLESHLIGHIFGYLPIFLSYGLNCLKDGIDDTAPIKGHKTPVSFSY
jgi:hypothetical protein